MDLDKHYMLRFALLHMSCLLHRQRVSVMLVYSEHADEPVHTTAVFALCIPMDVERLLLHVPTLL